MKNYLLILFGIVLTLSACDEDKAEAPSEVIRAAIVELPNKKEFKKGEFLNGTYSVNTFTSEDYAKNKGVSFQWYRNVSKTDKKTRKLITNATKSSYQLTKDDVGKYIQFTATVAGTVNGSKTSDYVGPIKAKQ